MPRHFSSRKVAQLDQMLKAKVKPPDIVKKLQPGRCKERSQGPSVTAVYRFMGGGMYLRNKPEKRGRKRRVPQGIARLANAERLKLLKVAKNEYVVIWAEIHKATKLALRYKGLLTRTHRMPGEDWTSCCLASCATFGLGFIVVI